MLDEFIKKLKKLEGDVHKLSTAPQPFQGDWQPINPGSIKNPVLYDSRFDAEINQDGSYKIDFTKTIHAGDKIRVRRNGNAGYDYGIAFDLFPTQFRFAGDMFAGDSIDEIAFSSNGQPIGAPTQLIYSNVFNAPVGSTFNENEGSLVTLYSVGALVRAANSCRFYITGSSAAWIETILIFGFNAGSTFLQKTPCIIENTTDNTFANGFFIQNSNFLRIQFVDGSNFAINKNYKIYLEYTYTIF